MGKKEIGENIANEYYKRLGYKIIAKNSYQTHGEIDLVLFKNSCLTFVEVKYRTTLNFIDPNKILNFYKKRALKLSINQFISKNELNLPFFKSISVELFILINQKCEKAYFKRYQNIKI